MRLTDVQVREIASAVADLIDTDQLLDTIDELLADREALLAENAKLRRVVDAARPFEPSGEWGARMAMITNGAATRDEGIAHCKVIVRAQRNLCDALAALDGKDATDDKN